MGSWWSSSSNSPTTSGSATTATAARRRQGQPSRSTQQTTAKRQDSTQNPLLDRPWRKLKGWEESTRNELERKVAGIKPELHPSMDHVKYLNILLAGQIGAGKSSFCNSVHSLFRREMINKAQVGLKASSLTKHFRMYEISKSASAKPFSWRICDTMGLEHTRGINAEHILAAVDGKIPDRFEFSEDILNNPAALNPYPELANKAHCVVVVVDASMCTQMKDEIWTKLRKLRDGLLDRKIPAFILLTKIDKLCPHVKDDITLVYRSKAVRRAIESTSKKLDELPESQIFPIKNYKEELELEDPKDILLLYAVRQMLLAAQGYLEEEQGARPHNQPVENTQHPIERRPIRQPVENYY